MHQKLFGGMLSGKFAAKMVPVTVNREIIMMAKAAENKYVGVNCGEQGVLQQVLSFRKEQQSGSVTDLQSTIFVSFFPGASSPGFW